MRRLSEADITNAVLAGVRRVPLVAVPATEAQNGFGKLVDQAAAGQDIAITRHNVERVVLVSAPRYHEIHELLAAAREVLVREVRERETRERRALLGDAPAEQPGERQNAAASPTTSTSPTPTLDRLTAEFEVLFARMQRPEVREATRRALRLAPEEMGRIAVEAAAEAARGEMRQEARAAARAAVPDVEPEDVPGIMLPSR